MTFVRRNSLSAGRGAKRAVANAIMRRGKGPNCCYNICSLWKQPRRSPLH